MALLEAALVELSVHEEDLHVTVHELPSFKASFKDLAWRAEQDTLALGSTFAPLTLIDRSVEKLADSTAMSHIIFPVTFVYVAAWQDHLALTVLESLRDATVIDLARHLTQLLLGLIDEIVPVMGHSLAEDLRDAQISWLADELNSGGLLILRVVLAQLEGAQTIVRSVDVFSLELSCRVCVQTVCLTEERLVSQSFCSDALSEGPHRVDLANSCVRCVKGRS